jgi:hypothetical protein
MEYKVNNNFNYTLLKSIVEKDGLRAFKFYKKIADNTSQGSVGILKCMLNDTGCTETLTMARDYIVEKKDLHSYQERGRDEKSNDDLIIYKIGTETPFLCRHEHDVSISLHKLSTYLPNFMRPFDLIRNARADPRQKNPFVSYIQTDCKKRSRHMEGIKRVRPKTFSDMALFEYIDSNMTLAQLLTFNVKGRRRTRVTSQDDLEKIKASQSNIINSLLNQLMIATIIAQQKLLFIHNDLHFDNVLVSKCFERTFMLYVFDINKKGALRRHENIEENGENVVCYALLPTFGYYPTIIDYGFSFSKDLIGGPLLTGIHHNNKGYMNHQYDEFTDFKTMLVRLAYSEYQFGLNDKDDFQNIVRKELLNRLPIDRQTGWDDTKDISVSKQLVRRIRLFIDDYLKNLNRESFFQKYEYELVDMICSLIILPLRKKNSDTLIDSLHKFFGEWFKIERWIGTPHMKIFVFKSIVDKIREDLLTNKTEYNMVDFQKTIYKIMNEVGDNIILSHLDYELFYKSIISLSDCFEDIMFKANQKCVKRKEKEYSRLRMKTSLDMYQLVEPFISVDYEIKYGDYFVVLNAINETTSSFVINDTCTKEFIDTVNDIDRTERAEYLFKSMV